MYKQTAMSFGLIALLLMFSAGCEDSNVLGTGQPGAFSYGAYDSTGTLLVTGWFTITIKDSAHISGDWHFSKIGDPENIGPQSGKGELRGMFYDGLLHVSLNPDYVDNNVFLVGEFSGHTYDGTWVWSGFPGVINGGKFRAARR